jgi:pimeloyl-ACP methyl ester carboxylesterase
MLELCLNDPDLTEFAFHNYEYPTHKTALKFWAPSPGLGSLAAGLKTEIEVRLANYEEILLVCHSMGGLVARRYLADELQKFGASSVKRALLLATPNSGATLASVVSGLGIQSAQTSMLRPFSNELARLNDDWAKLEADKHLDVCFVAAGIDAIVAENSVKSLPGRDLDSTLIQYGHSTITKPDSPKALNYLLVKSFLRKNSNRSADQSAPGKADPLFEVYKPCHEDFYVHRREDVNVSVISQAGNIWVTGASGVGKTAALTRAIVTSGAQLLQVYLGSYVGAQPNQLLKNIYLELADRLECPPLDFDADDIPKCVNAIKSLLRNFPKESSIVLMIEEIPLVSVKDYGDFCQHIHMLAEGLEAASFDHVRIAITSIVDPSTINLPNMAKFRAKMQFVCFEPWMFDDCHRLAVTLNNALGLSRLDRELIEIATASIGIPRLVKSVFRKWRNGTDAGRATSELIEQTRTEMI